MLPFDEGERGAAPPSEHRAAPPGGRAAGADEGAAARPVVLLALHLVDNLLEVSHRLRRRRIGRLALLARHTRVRLHA